ncbi:hypothetical protein [Amycolatopsis sp. ATCC 39116]|uniref:hypothetical protein n=1 Tax=Amycolatopsis sp. (strain ATCC 39116 / 75iv2) TaxID=385957 RepID=UPI00026258FC|nr:hypothetical protein [Amycolatopsis sp. ATCC 39116]
MIVAVITVVAVLGAVAVAISASRDDSPRPTAAGPASSLAPASTSATPRFTVVPGGPAPCDPARPDLFYCFDPALTSDALRSHILQRLPWWKCYGHRDPTAPPDLDVKGYLGICQGVARADRYLWTQEIKWTNTGYHPEAPLEEVTASASVIVFPGRGEHVEDAEMNQKSDGALQLALASLWPDDHAMGQAIYDVYKPLKAECDRGFDHPYPAMTPTGYKVGCMGTTRVTTTNRSGEEVIIRSASAQLSCPMTEEEALESHQLSNSPPAPTQ